MEIGGLIGLYGGLLMGGIGWWFGRKKAMKNRGIDELYRHIWEKARSYSWYFTIAAIYVLFSIYALGIPLKTPMVLGVLLLLHLGSWAITGVILNYRMTVSSEPLTQKTKVVLGVTFIVASFILFTVLSLVTQNWKFLLCSIPPNVLCLCLIIFLRDKSVRD